MRRLEYVGGSSEKFWEASCEDTAVTVRWGRLGTTGQTKRKEFADVAAAEAFLSAQAAGKLRKGYREIGAPTAVEPTAASTAAVPSSAEPAVAAPVVPASAKPAAASTSAASTAAEPSVAAPVVPASADPAAAPPAAASTAAEPSAAPPSAVPTAAEPPAAAPVVPASGDPAAAPPSAASTAAEPAATSTRPSSAPEATDWPDEDVFAPGTQVRAAYPRRDEGRAKFKADPAAAGASAALLDQYRHSVGPLVERSEPEFADAMARYLAGAADPLGAATAAAALAAVVGYQERRQLAKLASEWVLGHGPAFAAVATVLVTEIAVDADRATPRAKFLRRTRPGDRLPWGAAVDEVRGDVRRALASAGDEDYAAAVAEVGALSTNDSGACVAAFLLPTEPALVERAVAATESTSGWITAACTLAAVSAPGQLANLSRYTAHRAVDRDGRVVPTLLRTLGPGAAPAFAEWLEGADTDLTRKLLAALVEMPTDDAFTRLLVRAEVPHVRSALQEAARRYPRRAVRLLAEAAVADQPWSPAARDLLRGLLVAVPALVDAVVPGLAPAEREAARALLVGVERLPDAPVDLLPDVLRTPPWTRPRPAPPVVVPDLPVTDTARIAWLPGEERAAAAERAVNLLYHSPTTDWAADVAQHAQRGTITHSTLLHAPLELVEPLIAEYRPSSTWRLESWGSALLERFGLAALPALLSLATSADALHVLQPVLEERVARAMVAALDKKTLRPQALSWLTRHGAAALPFLLPTALGTVGRERAAAENVVRLIAADVGEAAVLRATSPLGADAVRTVLATDPLLLLPKKLPVAGAWVDVATLPQVRLRGQPFALSADAVRDLVTMLVLSRPGEPYGGVEPVVEACEPASLARFVWELFEQWRAAGMPPKDGWALSALGVLGDDDTVRALAPVIRSWPGEGGHARAVTGLDVLADIGTDVALMHLNGIAQKVKFAGLRERAREKIAYVAARLGLSPERLADRLVPDLGLSQDGSLVLDYGPRRFVVGFDERLKPFVSDEDGTPRKALPKPGVKDDEELATAAYQRFTGLKKDVRTLAADQLTRLERAMASGRTWSGAEFTEFLAGHPLLVHLVRRLVWVVLDGSGAVVGSFRVAEDRSLSTVDDDVYVLPEDAVVGVAHPVHLGESVAAWSEVFADYEILQPFPQLGRPVHEFTEEELAATRLARFEGVVLPTTRVLLLVRLGWERSAPMDGGVEAGLFKHLTDGLHAIVELDPGLVVGDLDALGDQTLHRVYLGRNTEGHRWHANQSDTTFAALDAVSASELLADLTELVEGATP
ncbi:DUF4132 domain-containing protein [Umezawaea sp.]|uniref:DUF4132 domain-containing protein n=1 Tax=Umezawaea sp. TaxID=1955258 RepID=UPI002ECFB1C0